MNRPRSRPAPATGPFALRFRLLMSYHDLTLRDLAEATASAVSTVGTWRNGRVPSSQAVVAKLAEIFHVSVDYLLEGRRTGRGAGGGAAQAAAGRILDDLEWLVQEVGPAEGGDWGREGRSGSREQEGWGKGGPGSGARGEAREHHGGGGEVARREVEQYLRAYLDRAELAPGGLGHAWVQLRREFPLDLYERL